MSRAAIRQKALEDLNLDKRTTWPKLWETVDRNKGMCPATADVAARLEDELDGARPMF